MKKILTIFLFVCCSAALTPLVLMPGCQSPSSRVTEVKTLKVIGASVDAAMKLSAQLYKDGKITTGQWITVAEFHDMKFLPAYNLAVSAVQANFDTIASPDIVGLAAQLSSIVASFTNKTP